LCITIRDATITGYCYALLDYIRRNWRAVKNQYGGVFEVGPCCGATAAEMPTETQFPYTVKKVNNRFLVQRLPLYVP